MHEEATSTASSSSPSSNIVYANGGGLLISTSPTPGPGPSSSTHVIVSGSSPASSGVSDLLLGQDPITTTTATPMGGTTIATLIALGPDDVVDSVLEGTVVAENDTLLSPESLQLTASLAASGAEVADVDDVGSMVVGVGGSTILCGDLQHRQQQQQQPSSSSSSSITIVSDTAILSIGGGDSSCIQASTSSPASSSSSSASSSSSSSSAVAVAAAASSSCSIGSSSTTTSSGAPTVAVAIGSIGGRCGDGGVVAGTSTEEAGVVIVELSANNDPAAHLTEPIEIKIPEDDGDGGSYAEDSDVETKHLFNLLISEKIIRYKGGK
uniref:Uncharacterized protein n=1 Tax=Anopheles atroparvus TaxID=41427 RepID=A0A182JCB2_ANOAO